MSMMNKICMMNKSMMNKNTSGNHFSPSTAQLRLFNSTQLVLNSKTQLKKKTRPQTVLNSTQLVLNSTLSWCGVLNSKTQLCQGVAS